MNAPEMNSIEDQLRAYGPWRCCPHCADDDLHGPELKNAHEIPCDLCLLDRAAYEMGRADAERKRGDTDALLREHREGWADWIESQGQYVGTLPMTQAEIVSALRSGVVPFGYAAKNGKSA